MSASLGSTTYASVTWTAGDVITEAKLDNMVANDQAYDSHAAQGLLLNNAKSLGAKNQAGSGNLNLIKLNSSDQMVLGDGSDVGLSAEGIIVDEDNMASNSDQKIPTQQSVKAFAGEATLGVIIDGGGGVISTGIKIDIEVPFNCTIVAATALADQSGSIVVDIWKDTYANYPPTDADSITSSAPVTISTATKSQDTTLTGWTVALTKGDILRFNVDSITTLTRVGIFLKVLKG